jgi:hypothetical protein
LISFGGGVKEKINQFIVAFCINLFFILVAVTPLTFAVFTLGTWFVSIAFKAAASVSSSVLAVVGDDIEAKLAIAITPFAYGVSPVFVALLDSWNKVF